jgi:hypothetical protein
MFFFKLYVLNFFNMLHTLCFFVSSKCRSFHNATFLGSCIIRILHTGVLKFKCQIPVPKGYTAEIRKPMSTARAFSITMFRKMNPLGFQIHTKCGRQICEQNTLLTAYNFNVTFKGTIGLSSAIIG